MRDFEVPATTLTVLGLTTLPDLDTLRLIETKVKAAPLNTIWSPADIDTRATKTMPLLSNTNIATPAQLPETPSAHQTP